MPDHHRTTVPTQVGDHNYAMLQNLCGIALRDVRSQIEKLKAMELRATPIELHETRTVRRMLEDSLYTYEQVSGWLDSVQLWYTTEPED